MRQPVQKQQHQAQKDNLINPASSREETPEPSTEAKTLLRLQRKVGNQAVLRMLQLQKLSSNHRPSLQAKLTVSSPGDSLEQEADRAAEKVMRMPDVGQQRACSCGVGCAKCQSGDGDRKLLQTKAVSANNSAGADVPPVVAEALHHSADPLDHGTRAFMEPRFGYDFSHVRVHTDARAARAAQAMSALAFTVGRDIVFGPGQYSPGISEGQRLIAHELAHVVQQGGRDAAQVSRQSVLIQRCPTPRAPGTPAGLAISLAPQARQWAINAVGALSSLVATTARPSREMLLRRPEFRALSRHFHVGPDNYLQALYPVRGVFQGIAATLARASQLFVDSPASGDGENAGAFLPEPRDGCIHITPLFQTGLGPVSRLYVLVHEAAHYQSGDIIDYSNPRRENSTYPRLGLRESMLNAYSFSEFAMEINRGTTDRTNED